MDANQVDREGITSPRTVFYVTAFKGTMRNQKKKKKSKCFSPGLKQNEGYVLLFTFCNEA